MSCLVVAADPGSVAVGRLSSSEMRLVHPSFSSPLSLSLSLSIGSPLSSPSRPTRPQAVIGHWVAHSLTWPLGKYEVILRSMGNGDGAFIHCLGQVHACVNRYQLH